MNSTDLNDQVISDALTLAYGREAYITPVSDADFKEEIADATLKFLAPTPDGKEGFLLVSGPGNPQLVGRAVSNILLARKIVSAQISGPILPAIATGQVAGREFAVWPLKHPYNTSNRLIRRVRNRLYAGQIIQWTEALCRETLSPADPETVLGDLQQICEDAAFPDDMRSDADQAQARLRSGQWQATHCLHHGDFWPENLLLGEPAGEAPFYVIDWAGMQREGYPFLDLSRMLTSLRCGHRFNLNSIERLRRDIGCDRQDVTAYILGAYGQIGKNLEHFPVDRYRAAALDMYRFIKRF